MKRWLYEALFPGRQTRRQRYASILRLLLLAALASLILVAASADASGIRVAQTADQIRQYERDRLLREQEARRREQAREFSRRLEAERKAASEAAARRTEESVQRAKRLEQRALDRALDRKGSETQREQFRRDELLRLRRDASRERIRSGMVKPRLPECDKPGRECCRTFFSTSYRESDGTVLMSGERVACPYTAKER